MACLLLPGIVLAEKTGAERLQEAYKKEFAFLEAEEAALKKRLAQIKRSQRTENLKNQSILAGLQKQIITRTSEADAMAERLVEVEREVDAIGEGAEALTGLLQQMSRALKSNAVDWNPVVTPMAEGATDAERTAQESARLAAEAAQLGAGFNLTLKSIDEHSKIRRDAGAFFLADGTKVEGTLIHVGRIAVYGVSTDHAGALTPAGGGAFKLDPVQGEHTARALMSGENPTQIGLFLFENTAENYEPKQEKTVLQIIESGGIIAWVIVGLGAFALLLIFIRALLLMTSRVGAEDLWVAIQDKLKNGAYTDAAQMCQASRGAGARIMANLAPALQYEREDVERVFSERMLVEEGRLDRLGSLILVIAAVAPLLGLLGTVTGMISTFDVITEFGTGNPKLLSGGISEALVTTELGLCVAIPALLLGNILNGWAARLKGTLEFSALRMINFVRCSGGPTGGNSKAEDVNELAEWSKTAKKQAV